MRLTIKAIPLRSAVSVIAFVLVVILTGCRHSGEPGLDSGDCRGGETTPFTVEELLEGMRAAGYDMYVDPGCSYESASWGLSNTSIYVPELVPEDFGRAQAREGAISCLLYDGTDGEDATVSVTHFEGEDWTTLHTLNVSCNITPEPTKTQEQIDRLEQTLNELAAAQS
jgi:hypothetical protein